MRQWCLVVLLVLITICGCANRTGRSDPIIGRWIDTKNGEYIIVFGRDRNVQFYLNTDRMRTRVYAKYPSRKQEMEAKIQDFSGKIRTIKARWKKDGTHYKVVYPDGREGLWCTLDAQNLTVLRSDASWFIGRKFIRENN